MNINARVLVVDDGRALQYHCKVLASANFAVQAAHCGDEALGMLAQEVFDVVFLECAASSDDGLAVLRAIKALCPDIEVVVITGAPSVQQAKDSIRFGACDYLVKPVAADEIIKVAAGAALQKKWALHRLAGQDTTQFTHQGDAK